MNIPNACLIAGLRVWILVLAFYVGLPAQSYKSLLQQGDSRYNVKSYAEAVDFYTQALKKRGNDLEVAVKLGECLWRCNRISEANSVFTSISGGKNLPASFYLYFGQSLRAAGNYREGRDQFVQYAAFNPTMGNHFADACDWALQNGNVSEVIQVSPAPYNSRQADFSPLLFKGEVWFSSYRGGRLQNFSVPDKADAESIGSPQVKLFSGVNHPLGHFTISRNPQLIAYSQWKSRGNVRLVPQSGAESTMKWGSLDLINFNYAVTEKTLSLPRAPSQSGYPFLSADGNSLFFSGNFPGGLGGMDIYVMYREGSGWTNPINLGPGVNSQGDEISPFLSGSTLYFSSDWHPGFGGQDVFFVKQQDNQWTGLTNLGLPVNSPFDDMDFSIAGNKGLLTSNRTGGSGAEDIYLFTRRPEGLGLRVMNALDESPLPGVNIDWGSCLTTGNVPRITNDDGSVVLPILLKTPCSLTLSKDGYATRVFPISELQTAELVLSLYRLNDLYLGLVLEYGSRQPLEDVEILAENPNAGISLMARTNSRGLYEYALKPGMFYNLLFKKAGFKTLTRVVNTSRDGRDKTVLGETTLARESASDPPPSVIGSGFAIQIVSFTSTPASNQFSELWNIADIYVKREDNQVKIRMGVFRTQAEVLGALERVKQSGYPQAFIVEEKNGPGFTRLVETEPVTPAPTTAPTPIPSISVPVEKPVGNPPPVTPSVPSRTEPVTPSTGIYKIQLVALRDTRFFDARQINHLGLIKDYKKPNNFTAKVIGDFSESDVRTALKEIQAKGFKDAFVVREVSGELLAVPGIR